MDQDSEPTENTIEQSIGNLAMRLIDELREIIPGSDPAITDAILVVAASSVLDEHTETRGIYISLGDTLPHVARGLILEADDIIARKAKRI